MGCPARTIGSTRWQKRKPGQQNGGTSPPFDGPGSHFCRPVFPMVRVGHPNFNTPETKRETEGFFRKHHCFSAYFCVFSVKKGPCGPLFSSFSLGARLRHAHFLHFSPWGAPAARPFSSFCPLGRACGAPYPFHFSRPAQDRRIRIFYFWEVFDTF